MMPGNKWTSAIVFGKMKEQASCKGEGQRVPVFRKGLEGNETQ